jgi:hypothetical protein
MRTTPRERAGVRGARRAIALLEVVLALAVFFGVAITILDGLSASMRAARHVKEDAQAADFAVTVLSEIQMGAVAATDAGPTPFDDPDGDWTWQVTATTVDTSVPGVEFIQVQIAIGHTSTGFTYRLYQLLPSAEDDAATAQASSDSMSGGAP